MVDPSVNPAAEKWVKRLREEWRPWIILTPAQFSSILERFSDRPILRAALILLANLGLRKGAVYAIRWSDIDWTHRLLHWRSKGKSGSIPLNDTALETLRGLAKFYQASRGLDLDVTPTDGKVFPFSTDTSLKRRWYAVRAELGLPDLRLHDLRVSFARSLSDEGVSLRTIQALLGHSTITMTARYVPPDLEKMREAVASLDRQSSQRAVGNRSPSGSRRRARRG